jgi:zinc transporter ZupT
MDGATFGVVLLASTLAGTITSLGIYLISRYREWANRNSVYFKGFAVGILIATSFLHLIPEALEMNAAAPAFILTGFLVIYLLNLLLHADVAGIKENTEYEEGVIPVLGIGLHSFIDGIIYTVTFNVSIFTGMLAAIGMVLHEFPEGIVSYVLLEGSGMSRRKAVFYAFLAAALSTPLGTLLSYPFVARITEPALGALLALAAGVLVYVAASHLLPAVAEEDRGKATVPLGVGVLITLLILRLQQG